MDKEFQELQDLIDTISTTAKLLGYKVELLFDNTVTLLFKPSSEIPDIVLNIYQYNNKTKFKTDYLGHINYHLNTTHQQKIDHLQKILQEL